MDRERTKKLLIRNLSSVHDQSRRLVLPQRSKSLPNINLTCPVAALLNTLQSTGKPATRPKILKKTWDKVKTMIHPQQAQSSSSSKYSSKRPTTPAATSSLPNTPLLQTEHFEFEDQQHRIVRNYELLQKRLSEELHQRMNECSNSSSGGKDHHYYNGHHVSSRLPVDGLSDEFRKRLVDWENWKARGMMSQDLQNQQQQQETGSSKRKDSEVKKMNANHQKELAWLDKQLEKIEREKKRLEREMNKYLEKEARLEKMKEALNAVAQQGGVVVRTPTAKCRVERITEKFAKKLYEWEEKRGVSVDESGFGLLNPKYFEVEENGERHQEQQQRATKQDSDDDDDGNEEEDDIDDDEEEEVVVGPLDLINARLKEDDEDENVRRAMADVAEAMALADEMMSSVTGGKSGTVGQQNEPDGRISSTASSCCCSEYEQTDSKHSNTDSEVYKVKRPLIKRRISSDTGGSGARSPSLSAFTSDDDDDDDVGCDEDLNKVENEAKNEQARDAESQTEVVVRAKQIVVEDNTTSNNNACTPGVFVQTKRTIFAPVLDGSGGEHKTVVIEDGAASASGSVGLLNIPSSSSSSPHQSSAPPPTPVTEDLDKPVVVGMVPKTTRTPYYRPQPKTQFHRSFPNNKVPVWCSPLVARRHFNNTGEEHSNSSSSSTRVPRKYTIGGGYMPHEGAGSSLLRSNSFGLRSQQLHQNKQVLVGGDDAAPNDLMMMSSVSKSKSTGSIKSRFKVFGGWFKSRSKEEQVVVEQEAAGNAGFSLRRIGSWVYRKGD